MRANTCGGVLGCAAAALVPLFVDAAPLDSTVQELQRRVDEQEAIIRGLRRELDALAKQVDAPIRPEGPTPAARRREGPLRHRPNLRQFAVTDPLVARCSA